MRLDDMADGTGDLARRVGRARAEGRMRLFNDAHALSIGL